MLTPWCDVWHQGLGTENPSDHWLTDPVTSLSPPLVSYGAVPAFLSKPCQSLSSVYMLVSVLPARTTERRLEMWVLLPVWAVGSLPAPSSGITRGPLKNTDSWVTTQGGIVQSSPNNSSTWLSLGMVSISVREALRSSAWLTQQNHEAAETGASGLNDAAPLLTSQATCLCCSLLALLGEGIGHMIFATYQFT